MGRAGWKVPVSLVYDSQNWRQDGGVNWQLGSDVGFGFGWKMLIGSVTPYYTRSLGAVDHYVYTDGSGAEYRLDVNNNGVWSSSHGVYVWFDSNTGILHFKDGTFWVMGCTSGGTEADAGTMYPTIIEDVSGNQVIVTYDAGAGLPQVQFVKQSSLQRLLFLCGKQQCTDTGDRGCPCNLRLLRMYHWQWSCEPLVVQFHVRPDKLCRTAPDVDRERDRHEREFQV